MENSELFKKFLTLDKINKLVEVAIYLQINPLWLFAVIYFETAKTFSPSKRNSIGSVGLIQFTRDKAGVEYKTINGRVYLLNDIAKMTFLQQMDLVKEYYKPFKGKMHSFIDVYLVTFFPLALGKSNDYILQTKGLSASIIAKQNPLFDVNKDGKITVGELRKVFSNFYTKNLGVDVSKKIDSFFFLDKLYLILLIPLITFIYFKYGKG